MYFICSIYETPHPHSAPPPLPSPCDQVKEILSVAMVNPVYRMFLRQPCGRSIPSFTSPLTVLAASTSTAARGMHTQQYRFVRTVPCCMEPSCKAVRLLTQYDHPDEEDPRVMPLYYGLWFFTVASANRSVIHGAHVAVSLQKGEIVFCSYFCRIFSLT